MQKIGREGYEWFVGLSCEPLEFGEGILVRLRFVHKTFTNSYFEVQYGYAEKVLWGESHILRYHPCNMTKKFLTDCPIESSITTGWRLADEIESQLPKIIKKILGEKAA